MFGNSLHACMLSHFSHIRLIVTLWTVTHQSPLSIGFSRQEHWNGLLCHPPVGNSLYYLNLVHNLWPFPIVIVHLLSCVLLCDPTDCSMPGFPVLHYLLEFSKTHVHWGSDAIQPYHPLSPPSSPALNLSQHQCLFQWIGSLHQVAKVLDFQLQHLSFQWIFRIDFLYNWFLWYLFSLNIYFLPRQICLFFLLCLVIKYYASWICLPFILFLLYFFYILLCVLWFSFEWLL